MFLRAILNISKHFSSCYFDTFDNARCKIHLKSASSFLSLVLRYISHLFINMFSPLGGLLRILPCVFIMCSSYNCAKMWSKMKRCLSTPTPYLHLLSISLSFSLPPLCSSFLSLDTLFSVHVLRGVTCTRSSQGRV